MIYLLNTCAVSDFIKNVNPFPSLSPNSTTSALGIGPSLQHRLAFMVPIAV